MWWSIQANGDGLSNKFLWLPKRHTRLTSIACAFMLVLIFMISFPSPKSRPTVSSTKPAANDWSPSLSTDLSPTSPSPTPTTDVDEFTIATLQKPDRLRVVAVIFYGRRDRSSILECYLRQNLVSNGGWLDEVIWAVTTEIEEDQDYARKLSQMTPEYTYLEIIKRDEPLITAYDWHMIYKTAFTDKDAVYVKIDDDMVFVDEHAIPRTVTTLLDNPNFVVVSANGANNPLMTCLHYHMGAIHPYVPEVDSSETNLSTVENGIWRPSQLPVRSVPDWEMPEIESFHELFDVDGGEPIPSHRWTRMKEAIPLSKTPIGLSQFDHFGYNLNEWPLAAQAHYSLLENIENGQLDRYSILQNGNDSTWNPGGKRFGANFMAIRGADVIDNLDWLPEDDEMFLTVWLPERVNREVRVETRAIVSHYAFQRQKFMPSTDLLARYHGYAGEMVCPNSMRVPEAILADANSDA